MSKSKINTSLLIPAGILAVGFFIFKKKTVDTTITGIPSTYSMERGNGYGQYRIVKTTPSGKITKVHSTDSQAWDDLSEGKCSQARLKRLFDWSYQG